MRTHGMASLHVSPNTRIPKMDSQVIGRIRLESVARGRTTTSNLDMHVCFTYAPHDANKFKGHTASAHLSRMVHSLGCGIMVYRVCYCD